MIQLQHNQERERVMWGESKWNGGDEKERQEWGWRERTDCGRVPNPTQSETGRMNPSGMGGEEGRQTLSVERGGGERKRQTLRMEGGGGGETDRR